MDADVISLEAARSDMSVLDDLTEAVATFPRERLWVNPDCGLKTRDYPEVRASLENLVSAARRVREQG